MLTLIHEKTIEINVPLEQAWDYSLNPENWLNWMDCFEHISIDNFQGKLKKGSVIQAKAKGFNLKYNMQISELEPFKKATFFMQTFSSLHKSSISFETVSDNKTQVKFHMYLRSFFVPFMRPMLIKGYDQQIDAYSKLFPPTIPHI